MPNIQQPLVMVSESVATQYRADVPGQQWSSATYTSSAPPARREGSSVSSDAILRESVTRFASAAHHHQSSFRGNHQVVLDEQSDEEYMLAREHYEETYWRAREEAHTALAQMHQQRQQEEEEVMRALQRSNTRSSRTPTQHRVYLINCKSCGQFLTDRGMKAVLLLRPHITLYSTDAVPNCGPLYPPSHPCDAASANEPVVERTCNCLTQTLGCYGCGNAVGYHIVSPCSRCTSSVAKHQRNSNGHRTVLHCAEISVRERRYVPGEQGVLTAPLITATSANERDQERHYASRMGSLQTQLLTRRGLQRHHSIDRGEAMDAEDKDGYVSHNQSNAYREAFDPTSSQAIPSSTSAANKKGPRVMKRGDVVYWSDLVSGGERCEPIDSDEVLAMPIAGR